MRASQKVVWVIRLKKTKEAISAWLSEHDARSMINADHKELVEFKPADRRAAETV